MTKGAVATSQKPEKNDPEFWADLHTFIGPDAPVLIDMWRETPKGKLPSIKYFSFPALLFGPFWFLYRKLYLWAVILIGLIGAELALLATALFPTIGRLVLIVTGIGIGVVANKIYVNWAVQRVKAIRATVPDLHQRQVQLKKKGGVSAKGIFLGIAAAIVLLLGTVFVILVVSPVRWN